MRSTAIELTGFGVALFTCGLLEALGAILDTMNGKEDARKLNDLDYHFWEIMRRRVQKAIGDLDEGPPEDQFLLDLSPPSYPLLITEIEEYGARCLVEVLREKGKELSKEPKEYGQELLELIGTVLSRDFSELTEDKIGTLRDLAVALNGKELLIHIRPPIW